jgi:hypothetical protein
LDVGLDSHDHHGGSLGVPRWVVPPVNGTGRAGGGRVPSGRPDEVILTDQTYAGMINRVRLVGRSPASFDCRLSRRGGGSTWMPSGPR